MSALVPCPRCNRHVHGREPNCPFCASALSAPAALGPPPKLGGRLSRAALVAAGAALLGAAACDESVAVPVYGAPAPDAGADAADARQPDATAGGEDGR